jgi:predicted esterase
MRRSLLALAALLVLAAPPARVLLAKGGKPAVEAPTWTEEDGRTVLHVFAPSPLKAYYVPPTNLAEGKKAELIIVLHGHGGTATGMLGDATSVADGRGGAVLACEGSGTLQTDRGEGHSWSDPDVQGVLACLDATLAKHPIDPKRVVLMGHSAGGTMSVRIHAARPASFAGVYTSAAPAVPTGANKGGRFVVNLGTKDQNFAGFPGAVAASEKTVVARVVAVIDLPHELPHVGYSKEAVAWLLDSRAPSEVLRVPLVPGDEVRAPPDSPAAKAKGKGFRHILLFEKGGRGAPADALEKAAVKAAAQAIASEWKKATDFGELVASKSQDPLSKDVRGLVTGEVLARYGGALVTAMAKLKGGDVSAPVEGDAGWHVVARDPE